MRKLFKHIVFALTVVLGSKLFIKSSVAGAFLYTYKTGAQTFIWESRTTTKNTMLYKQLSPTSVYGNRWHVIYINADSMIWRHPRMYFDSLKLQSDQMLSSGKIFWIDNTTGAARATRMDSVHLDWNKINGRPDVSLYATSSNAMSFTNKTGNISQWTNDAGYLTSFTEADPLFNTKFAAKSTSDLAEGSGLYYTNTRARGAVSAGIGLIYNNSTGQFITDTNAAVSGNSAIMYMGKANTAITNLQNGINSKEPAITAGTTAQYWRGDKTWQTLNSTAVGLGNVQNVDQTNASNLTSGTVGTARLGSGTANASTVLYGNGTWGAIPNAPGSSSSVSYASGTPYATTTTYAKVDFGTTDPSITLGSAGTWVIFSNLKLSYAGLTNLATQTCTFRLRRVNNTAADLSNIQCTFEVPAVTLLTQTAGDADMPFAIYTTTNNNDVIEMWGNRGASISVGAINVSEAWIIAFRIN